MQSPVSELSGIFAANQRPRRKKKNRKIEGEDFRHAGLDSLGKVGGQTAETDVGSWSWGNQKKDADTKPGAGW